MRRRLAWVQGEILKPVAPTMAEIDPVRAGGACPTSR